MKVLSLISFSRHRFFTDSGSVDAERRQGEPARDALDEVLHEGWLDCCAGDARLQPIGFGRDAEHQQLLVHCERGGDLGRRHGCDGVGNSGTLLAEQVIVGSPSFVLWVSELRLRGQDLLDEAAWGVQGASSWFTRTSSSANCACSRLISACRARI